MSVGDLIPWRNRGLVSKQRERDPFFALHDQVERVFDDFTRSFGLSSLGERGFGGPIGWPNVDVKEDEKRFCVEAELPGLDKDDVELLLTDNVLTIRGEKRVEQDDSKRHYSERYFGQFERRIPLHADVESEQVKASFKNGVLKVEIPKSKQAQERVRRITVS
jgi:HSP20 family protein